MNREIIVSILEAEGAEPGTGGLAIREDREATCFVSTPGELLNVGRIVRVELKERYLVLQTAKDERFCFAYEGVLGFKLAATLHHKERTAGFGR